MRYSNNFIHQHANGKSTWHFEWCTKYRYKVFNKDYNKNLCTIALTEAAKKAKIVITEMEVQPEHVHMIVELPLTNTPINAIKTVKSISAKILFCQMPKLRLLYPKNRLWSRGKFAITVGNITLEKAKEYVRNQMAHHAKTLHTGILARVATRVSPQAEGSAPRRRSISFPIKKHKLSLIPFLSVCLWKRKYVCIFQF